MKSSLKLVYHHCPSSSDFNMKRAAKINLQWFLCSWNRNWLYEWLLQELIIDLGGLRSKIPCTAAVTVLDKIKIKNINCLIKSKIFSLQVVWLPLVTREGKNS